MSYTIILIATIFLGFVGLVSHLVSRNKSKQFSSGTMLSALLNLAIYAAVIGLLLVVMSCLPPPPSGWQDAWLAKSLAWYPLFIGGFVLRGISVWGKDKTSFDKLDWVKTLSYFAPGLAILLGLLSAYFLDPHGEWHRVLSGYSVEQGQVLANAWLSWLQAMEVKPLPLFLVGLAGLVGLVFGKSKDYSNLGLMLSHTGTPLVVYLVGTLIVGFILWMVSTFSVWVGLSPSLDESWFSEWLSWWAFWFLGLISFIALYVKAYEGGSKKSLDRAGLLVFVFPAIGVILGFLGGYNWVEWSNSPTLAWFYQIQNPWEFYTDSWTWWITTF